MTQAIGELGTNCTTNYEIEPKRISENITNFFLNKFIYSDTCTKDKNPDDYILKKICNTQKNVGIFLIFSKTLYYSLFILITTCIIKII